MSGRPSPFPSSRMPGFHKNSLQERIQRLVAQGHLDQDAAGRILDGWQGLSPSVAEAMVENCVGLFSLPVGVGLNLVVNRRDHLVPMAIEEPSVVAALCNAAKATREAGGFTVRADPPLALAQIQLVGVADPVGALTHIHQSRAITLQEADGWIPNMVRRGGGVRDVEARHLEEDHQGAGAMVVVHLWIDTRDAMGANVVNRVAEGMAPYFERLTGGQAILRIVSNLPDRSLVHAECRLPVERLARGEMDGLQAARRMAAASRLAQLDPYRATTHNKGIFNGIDAILIATGNDWRAVEAGGHAYAARDGQYRGLSRWEVEPAPLSGPDHNQGEGHLELVGHLDMPMAVGTVGGPLRVHPMAQEYLALMGVRSSTDLREILAAAGLAQNMAALWALATEGINQGHMRQHARSLAVAAGAPSHHVEEVANQLTREKDFRLETARRILNNLLIP